MTSRLLIWLLVVGALVLACGPHVRTTESASPADAARDAANDAARKTLASSLDVKVNNTVTLTLHVTNRSDGRVEITFPSGQTHDFVVHDSAGRNVWRWSEGRLFTQAIRNKNLDAKETLSYDVAWRPTDVHGRFTAIATLRSSNYPVRDSVEFELK
jgi:hypothetical protein